MGFEKGNKYGFKKGNKYAFKAGNVPKRKIFDEFTDLPVSRQVKYLKRKAKREQTSL